MLGNTEVGHFRDFEDRVSGKQNHSSTWCLFYLSLPSLARRLVEQAALLLCWRDVPGLWGAGEGTRMLEFLPVFEIPSSSELLFLEIQWPVRYFWWLVLSFPHYFLLCSSCCKDMSWFLWNKKQWFAVLQIQCLALVELPLQLMCPTSG